MNYIGARRDRRRFPGVIDQKNFAFNRLHGCPYAIDTYSTYYPYNLIDTNDGTAWVSASWMSAVPWIVLDLGSPKTVAKLRVNQSTGSDYATQLRVDCSDDYSTWVTVHTSPAGLGAGEYLWYPPCLRYRYWKVLAIAASWTYGWNVNSFELWGPVS